MRSGRRSWAQHVAGAREFRVLLHQRPPSRNMKLAPSKARPWQLRSHGGTSLAGKWCGRRRWRVRPGPGSALLVRVDRLMGQSPRTGGWLKGEHAQQGCLMSSLDRQGLAPSSTRGDRCATVAINCLPAQAGKALQPAIVVVCHGCRVHAIPSQATHHDVLPSCSVAGVHILSRLTCLIHQSHCQESPIFSVTCHRPASVKVVRRQVHACWLMPPLLLFPLHPIIVPSPANPDILVPFAIRRRIDINPQIYIFLPVPWTTLWYLLSPTYILHIVVCTSTCLLMCLPLSPISTHTL